MFTKTFFKFFPPPHFLNEPYAGIDISDTAVHCIQFTRGKGKFGREGGLVISKYGTRSLEPGIVDAGFIKEKEKLVTVLAGLVDEMNLERVRAALPEEEIYIFKTQVPAGADRKTMSQNIEFRLEENVPLSPANAIFYFDIIPGTFSQAAGTVSVSVAVASRKVIETYLDILNSAGLTVIAFEIQARALARALMQKSAPPVLPAATLPREAVLIVHVFNKKIGIYVVYDGIVCFTSTIIRSENLTETISAEIKKIQEYWSEHGEGKKEINRIIVLGAEAVTGNLVEQISASLTIPVEVGSAWRNAFTAEDFVSPITAVESLDYAVAAGLAFPIKI